MNKFLNTLTFLILVLLLSVQNVGASVLKAVTDLESHQTDLDGKLVSLSIDKIKSGFSGAPVESEYVRQAKLAETVLCKQDTSYRSLQPQNVWSEVQAIAKIQKFTTLKYIETCSDSTIVKNEGFCSKSKPGLLSHYTKIQDCGQTAVDERIEFITKKLGKNKILSCTNMSPVAETKIKEVLKLEGLSFVNNNYAALSFSDVKELEDLEPAICNIGGKTIDLKTMLIGEAFAKCIAPNPVFVKCLKNSCTKIDGTCILNNQEKCVDFVDKIERDFSKEESNKCFWNEVRNPTGAKIKELNTQCRGMKEFFELDMQLEKVKPSFATSICTRSIGGCQNSVKKAFVLQEKGNLCDPNKSNSKSRSSGGSAAGSK